ncbi:MBL fold metallo-hydrolase [Paenibacillus arenilitoris]|uniref:MBL fold metallo-hydrolase n=1 Tax=Paenibacillus arenilitoris TaxID=2772299 RepID=A0A927CST0_9BACL|nr:MBL fold metallo-hydrolase [Paenibacillus arenilitoris]MBD2870940.1 MBL fold metallo-hydrolase [Paenibacillus arenilitoris]
MTGFAETQHSLKPAPGSFALAWTGQAGFSFKDATGAVYHIDPYLSDICSRFVGYHRAIPAPVTAERIRGDYFLFTHEHRDHLDDDSMPAIAANNSDAMFIGPPACIDRLRGLGIASGRLVPIGRNESRTIGGIAIRAVLAVHTDDSVGYLLTIGECNVYVTGDTVYSDELIEVAKERPELMMSCMNGRLGCMNIADAVRLTSHIQPKFAIPMHFGMFVENTADPGEYMRQVELHSGVTKGFLMKHGVWYAYSSAEGLHESGGGEKEPNE